MAIVGIPEFVAFCLKYPGESRYQMACQGSELMIGLGKLYCDSCGTGKYDMPEKLGDYYDLTGTSMVYHNNVDFSKILKILEQEKLLIFDWAKTPQEEAKLESEFPPLMKFLVEILEKFEIGDKIPEIIHKIYSQLQMDVWNLNREQIQTWLAKNDTDIESTTNIDLTSDEYSEVVEHLQSAHKNSSDSMRGALRFQSMLLNADLSDD